MPRKRTGNIQDRGTSFRIRYTDRNGLRHHESYTTREEAEDQLAIRLGQLARGVPASSRANTVLFGELADDVLTDYEINNYASTPDQEARFRLHLIPYFGNRRISQITSAEIQTYIKGRQAEGAKTGTINRELELMHRTFEFAKQGDKLFHAPHVPHLREDNVREGFFTPDEVDRLCGQLPKDIVAVTRFGYMTGWRIGEIRKLLWEQVDFAANEIRLWVGRTKNREGRVFPMTDELRGLLESIKPARIIPSSHVFTQSEFRKTWKTACYKAGLPCTVRPIVIRGHVQQGKVKVVKCARTFHDLRRSFAREMDKMGVRQGAIMKLGGWKTDSVFRRYNIVSENDLRDAAAQINAKRSTKGARRGGRKR
jgi:integrase